MEGLKFPSLGLNDDVSASSTKRSSTLENPVIAPVPQFTGGLVLPEDKARLLTAQDESELENYERAEVGTSGSSLLGRGAFGQVFLMRHRPSNKLVAVKVINKKAARGPSAFRALAQEIEIHKRLLHDNIIRLYEFFEGPKNIYIVMEYASKGTLFHYIRRRKRLDENDAFRLFFQACNAVHFLHSHKLMHRDIKPENLLFTDNATLKLGDFGCCCDNLSGERKTFCGTPEYIAPEIIRGQPYAEKADIWSLGVMLYEMLHGSSPFACRAERDVLGKVLDNKLVFSPEVSEDARDLLQSILNNEPKDRPDTEQILASPWAQRMAASARKSVETEASPIERTQLSHEHVKAASANAKAKIHPLNAIIRARTEHERAADTVLKELPRGLVYGYPECTPSPIRAAGKSAATTPVATVTLVEKKRGGGSKPEKKSTSFWEAAFSFSNEGDL